MWLIVGIIYFIIIMILTIASNVLERRIIYGKIISNEFEKIIWGFRSIEIDDLQVQRRVKWFV